MKEERIITFNDIQKANETIQTTDIKGKEYAEVNQRIKAFRMVYPTGTISTLMLSNENGVCIFKANVCDENGFLLGTGTAYEKENSSFINKTSYIENCETSAVGRALGMAGFGIDTSVASAEEVRNAINNQEVTQEDAENYVFAFGKHKGKKLIDLVKSNDGYINWLLNNNEDENLLKCIELLTGQVKLTEDEQEEILDLTDKMMSLELTTNTSHDAILEHYGVSSNKDMTLEQLRDCVSKLEKKANGE
jgi:uncharacterized protein (DUF3820 family)